MHHSLVEPDQRVLHPVGDFAQGGAVHVVLLYGLVAEQPVGAEHVR